MPWPFLPPNPDTRPAPHDGGLFVFGLSLTGMRPFDEQAEHTFQVDGVRAGVYVPIIQNAGTFQYSGVCMAPLGRVGTTATFKGTYTPLNKSNAHPVEVDARQLTGSVTSVSSQRSGTKVVLTVTVDAGGASGLWVVASPFMTDAPRFTNHESYVMSGGSQALASGATSVKITLVPGPVTQYCVYLASGLPSGIQPVSAGKLVKP